MPKLITVVTALALTAFTGPALAQDAPPPPPSAEPTGEQSETPAEPTGADAGPPSADAPPTGGAAPPAAAPSTQPSDVEAPATQPAGVDAPSTRPADVDAPASQPAGAATQPAGDGEAAVVEPAGAEGTGAEEGGGTLLSGDVTRADVMERRLVAYVSTGVAAVALGTGITLGTLALGKYNCLDDVLVCNEGLEEPIVGETFLDQKAEVETLSLLADMAYVVAAAATIVAVTGYIRGYWLTDEDAGAEVTP